jgi:hypothetical protein
VERARAYLDLADAYGIATEGAPRGGGHRRAPRR